MHHPIKLLSAFCFAALASCATEPPAAPTDDVVARGGTPATCWDGVTLPRPALEPAALASVAAKYAAYNAALLDYQAAAAAYSAQAQAHADAYNALALPITGRLCATSADCSTGSGLTSNT
jgi:hypothetical protein